MKATAVPVSGNALPKASPNDFPARPMSSLSEIPAAIAALSILLISSTVTADMVR
jgi:hypothetical protein